MGTTKEFPMSETNEPILDEVVLEEYASRGEQPPRARRYRIRIDRQNYTVEVSHMLGREILTLAGKTPPEQYKLREKLQGGQARTIGLDEDVDFTARGVERFMTLRLDQTEGLSLRRAFKLPAADHAFLDSTGLAWETIVEGGKHWLLIHDYRLPPGYAAGSAMVALLIPPGYPDSQIDMVYLAPSIARLDGVTIKALAQQRIDGNEFQRWSRHRTSAHPWRPGIDDISSHMALVDDWLEREFRKP